MASRIVSAYGETIKSRYSSTCKVCLNQIIKGDLVTKRKNPIPGRKAAWWVHPECYDGEPFAGGAIGQSGEPSEELEALRSRIDELEAKLEEPHGDADLEPLLDQIQKLSETVNTMRPKVTHIHMPSAPEPIVVTDEHLHAKFELLMKLLELDEPIMLPGPTGCGKTHLCEQLARYSNRDFGYISCSGGMSESQILGRLLPTGKSGTFEYQETEFIRIYESGGLFLFDEMDACDPNVLVSLNSALANGHVSVPGRPAKPYVVKHKDTRIIAATNTMGNGADHRYSGREQLDAATLNRFQMFTVPVEYDFQLEAELCPDPELNEYLNQVRHAVRSNRLERDITTRTKIKSYQLVRAGFTMAEIKELLFVGWSRDEVSKCDAAHAAKMGVAA